MKRKILFLIHNFSSGGAQKVLLQLVNNMDLDRFDITVQTIYNKCDLKNELKDGIKFKTIITTTNKYLLALESYFIRRIASPEWTYKHFIEDDYDCAVAYLEGECTRLVGG